METRSIVVSALILALVAGGGIFYVVGRQAGIVPDNLATRLTNSEATLEDGAAMSIRQDDALEATATPEIAAQNLTQEATDAPERVGMAEAPTLLPPAALNESSASAVAGAADVAPTAATGGGATLLLAATLAMIVGLGGVLMIMRSAR